MKTRTSHNTKYRFVRSNKQQPINKSNQSKSITSSKTSQKKQSKSLCVHVYVCVYRCVTKSNTFSVLCRDISCR